MHQLRTLLIRNPALALLAIMAALCLKVVVPAGFMVGQDTMVLTVEICADASGAHTVQKIVIPAQGADSKVQTEQAKGGCPFAPLSMAAVSPTDAMLQALALAFILALGFAAAPISLPGYVAHLRPPLRGPPGHI